MQNFWSCLTFVTTLLVLHVDEFAAVLFVLHVCELHDISAVPSTTVFKNAALHQFKNSWSKIALKLFWPKIAFKVNK